MTKPRQTGAQEAREASTELPAVVNPGKKRLAEVLSAFEKATADLGDARSHWARAESDEAAALDSSGSDAEDKIAVAIRSKGIYSARVTNREAAQKRLLSELKLTLNASHHEFSALVDGVLTQRRGILRGRMIETGHLVGRFGDELEMLLESSQLILDVRSLEIPSQAVTYSDSPEQITGMARRILASYEAIAAKQKEQL